MSNCLYRSKKKKAANLLQAKRIKSYLHNTTIIIVLFMDYFHCSICISQHSWEWETSISDENPYGAGDIEKQADIFLFYLLIKYIFCVGRSELSEYIYFLNFNFLASDDVGASGNVILTPHDHQRMLPGFINFVGKSVDIFRGGLITQLRWWISIGRHHTNIQHTVTCNAKGDRIHIKLRNKNPLFTHSKRSSLRQILPFSMKIIKYKLSKAVI